jgi:phospho-N-acetylmuramoyl-pentapeptide-transferase
MPPNGLPLTAPPPYLLGFFAPFLLGVLVALGVGWIVIPMLRKLKAGQIISGDAPKSHQSKGGTPTMGGIIIVLGGLIPALFYPTTGEPGLKWAVVLCTLGFGAVGFLDDYLIIRRGKNLGLRAREKLLGQFIVAIAFAGWYLWAHPGQAVMTSGSLGVERYALAVYHVLLLVGMSNAVNLTDGLDGLAAGVSMPVWLTLGVLAMVGPLASGRFLNVASDYGMLAMAAAFAGATLGYLWYNAHPAQVFMGDTGSLAIGGGLGAVAIALRVEWLLLLVAAVHLAEAASVTIQVISFKTTGKRVFKMSPLHHHYELCGLPETRIVARFGIVSALCGVLALVIAFWG